MLGHITGRHHPESPERLAAVLGALEGDRLDRRSAERIADTDLARVHPQAFIDAIRAAAPADGRIALDEDTLMSPGSE